MTAFDASALPAGQIGNVAFPPREVIRGPSTSSTALDPEPTAQTDPQRTLRLRGGSRSSCAIAAIRITADNRLLRARTKHSGRLRLVENFAPEGSRQVAPVARIFVVYGCLRGTTACTLTSSSW
jgi:hypothetical protein